MKNSPLYGGFAACYIASTIKPEEVKQHPEKLIQYGSKKRKERSYKRTTK